VLGIYHRLIFIFSFNGKRHGRKVVHEYLSVAAVFWTAKLQNVSVKQRAEVQNLARIVCNPAICFLRLSVRQSVAPLLLLLSFFLFSIRFSSSEKNLQSHVFSIWGMQVGITFSPFRNFQIMMWLCLLLGKGA
ncbi:MAG: hypothetical protein ACFNTB_02625, partial [Prevotella denticola]